VELYLTPPYVFKSWCLITEAQGQLYFSPVFNNVMSPEQAIIYEMTRVTMSVREEITEAPRG
jgi:hypothetical protein